MNSNGYYQSRIYQNQRQDPFYVPQQGTTPSQNIGLPVYNNNQDPMENTPGHVEYADNIFFINIGKRGSFYFSYPDSVEWRDRVFTGVIEDAGKDYLIIRDDDNNAVLLWLIYINFAIFDGDIKHNYMNR